MERNNITHFLKLDTDTLIIMLLVSAVIGVAFSYGDLYLFHIFLSFLFFTWLYQLKENGYKLDINIFSENNFTFFYLMFFWYSISLIWAPDIQLALKYIFYIFCGILITGTIIYYSYSLDRFNYIFRIFSILFITELIVSIIESFSTFRMPISSYSSLVSYFGKEPVDFFTYDNVFAYSDFTPPTGFHWNTNNLAISMLMILPFFLCSQRIMAKSFGVISITMITVMTASRAVFLGLILTYCIYLVVIKKKIGTLVLIWIATIGLFWGMSTLTESENTRINEVANSIEALKFYLQGDIDIGGSLEWRRELVDNGLEALSKTYGLGLGAGGSTANQIEIGAVAGRFTSMHNFWIELLVEGGIVFGILIFLWYIRIIFNLFILSRKKKDIKLHYYTQSLFLSMIGFIPSSVAASSTIYFFPMWIMFGMAISVISINNKQLVLK